MKRRLVILITTLIILTTLFFLSVFLADINYQRIMLAVFLVALFYLLSYIIFGIGKFVVLLIYSIFITLLLVFLNEYDTALIFVGTFILFLNPLHEIEKLVDQKFPEEKSFISYFKGSYSAYYEYRKEVKDYYHLPQVRKTYLKPNYLKLRQALTIVLAMIAIFLLIREVNNLINLLKMFDIHLFFASTYSVVVLLVLTIILYRKGFQSMFNFFTVSIFPPIIYTIFLSVKPSYLSLIIGIVVTVFGIVYSIYQYIAFRSRIVYEYYYYYDQEKHVGVYANALFEPHIYNSNFCLTTKFSFKVNKQHFDKKFHDIIVYADFKKFFITAYTFDEDNITIYTDFHYGTEKKIEKFKIYLENSFNEKVSYSITDDKSKVTYEKEFYHNTNYIIARTLYLSEILKKFQIKTSVIITITAYFNSLQDLKPLTTNYSIARIPELEVDGIYTVNISFRTANIDYLIETKTRELLLDLLINKGNYVRVSVYY
ncbi:hypothetical protein [Haploplasma modicum]|uniref:hypothetical protein n=1 Tax=Haploplasma modicum TaxID=2150 RepID=UPI00047E2D3E|nr:hypothetical protein [Haploplasma modicum]